MPGKVNPVIPEVVTQVAAQVIGNDQAITVGGLQGHFELNVFIPMMARNLLDSIKLLSSASRLLAEKCVDGIEANREQCESYAELTLSAATALNPYIGYDKAAEIVKKAAASGRSLREVAREEGVEDAGPRRGARLPQDGKAARQLEAVSQRSPKGFAVLLFPVSLSRTTTPARGRAVRRAVTALAVAAIALGVPTAALRGDDPFGDVIHVGQPEGDAAGDGPDLRSRAPARRTPGSPLPPCQPACGDEEALAGDQHPHRWRRLPAVHASRGGREDRDLGLGHAQLPGRGLPQRRRPQRDHRRAGHVLPGSVRREHRTRR